MRRILTICMIMALAVLPLVAGAQPTSKIPEGRSTEGYLFPEGAHPQDANPGEASFRAAPDRNLVRDAQMALREAGFDPGKIDGVMGRKTQAALREYQASQGLPQTGRLDETTQRQLLAAYTPESSGRR